MQFARRTEWSLETNALTDCLSQLRAQDIKVLDLTSSNPTKGDFVYPQELLSSLTSAKNFCYVPDSQGMHNARKAVSVYYHQKGFEVPQDRVFLTSSTSEAYSYLLRLLANPGDQVLFPRPSYPLFSFLADLNDVTLEPYSLEYAQGQWGVKKERLDLIFSSDVKAITLVNPNNPTGSFVQKEDLHLFNVLCEKYQAAIICDEVFWDFAFDVNQDRVSLVNNKDVLTFVLGGLSKTLGLPQMKLSWIILNGPDDIVQEAKARLEVIADTYLSVNTPVQNALEYWLPLQKRIQGEIKERLLRNGQFLKDRVKLFSNYELLEADGGWYAILKVPTMWNEEEWVLELLNNKYVLVHPGYFFDFEEAPHIVLSLLTKEDIFKEGIQRILKD